MNLPETGVFDVSWTAVSEISGYKVDFHKGGVPFAKKFIEPSGVSSLSFTGYSEGESGRADVFTYKKLRNHKIYSQTGIYTESKFFNPENFNITSGSSFAFTGIKVNNSTLDLHSSSSGVLSTGSISNYNFSVAYDLISPRDQSLISKYQEFNDEPFADLITGYFYDSSGYHVSLPKVESSVINHEYTGVARNFYLNLVASDFFTGSTTGIVKLDNNLISVIDLASTSGVQSTSGLLSFYPSYSRPPTEVHASLYSDSSFSSLDQALTVSGSNNFSFSVPLNSSRFLKIIPYDRLGSGNHLLSQTNFGVIDRLDATPDNSKIVAKSVNIVSGHRTANIYGYTNLESYSGYHLDLSIYTGVNSSSSQYFSGSFNQDISYEFDITGSRSGSEENFNVDFLLYKSGESIYLDSGSLSFRALYPTITNTGFSEINNVSRQDFDFSWDASIPDMESYLTFLVNYDGVSQYISSDKSLSLPITSSRQRELSISLADKNNTGIIYDSLSITGVSPAPSLPSVFNVNNTFYAPKYDQYVFEPLVATNKDFISGYHLFEKKSFSDTHSKLTGLKHAVESFPLSSDYLSQSEGNVQYINIASPEGVSPSTTGYQYSGSSETGYYASGNVYHYKVLPYDFIGSGSPFEFDVAHSLTNFTKVIRQDTDTTIVNVTTVTSEVSSVGTNLSGVSGSVNTVSFNLSGVSGTVDTVNTNLSTVSGTVDTTKTNLSTVSGTANTTRTNLSTVSGRVDLVDDHLVIVSGRTEVLPTGNQVLSGSLNITGDSHVSGDLNVGKSSDNVLFSVHGTGSFINSNLEVSGRLAVSGRLTLGGDAPTSSTNTGIFGQVAFDNQYFYVCTGTNKWGRVELSNW